MRNTIPSPMGSSVGRGQEEKSPDRQQGHITDGLQCKQYSGSPSSWRPEDGMGPGLRRLSGVVGPGVGRTSKQLCSPDLASSTRESW